MPSLARQLLRDRDLVVAGDAGVLPLLGRLGRIPECRAVLRPGGGTGRHEDLGVHDVALARVVVHFSGPLIDDELTGAIGRGGCRGATGGAGYRLDGEMEHRGGKRRCSSGLAEQATYSFASADRTDLRSKS